MLRIRVIGGFAVERDGTVLSSAQLGSRKARTALKLLAAQRGLVPMDRLVEVLWGEHPPTDAAANVATLVSRLRATLGAGVIDGGRGGYRLVPGPEVVVDLEEAAGLVAEAESRLAANQPSLWWPPTPPWSASAPGSRSSRSPRPTGRAMRAGKRNVSCGAAGWRGGGRRPRWAITVARWGWQRTRLPPTASTKKHIGR